MREFSCMTTLHENCGGNIIRWGGRRRRCGRCDKTWSLWKRRRSRKRNRTVTALAHKYVQREIPPLSIAARQRAKSENQLQRVLKQSAEHFLLHTPWPVISTTTPSIAVADAVMVYAEKRIYTFYLILLRPIDDHRAVITKP